MIHVTNMRIGVSLFVTTCFLSIGIAEEKRVNREAEGPPVVNGRSEEKATSSFKAKMPGQIGARENGKEKDGDRVGTGAMSGNDREPGMGGDSKRTAGKTDGVGEPAGQSGASDNSARMPTSERSSTDSKPHRNVDRYGRLEIETEPSDAQITISLVGEEVSEEAGTTPLKVRLPANLYRVSLAREGYEAAVAEVSVEPGRTARLRIKMTPARSGVNKGLRLTGHLLFWPGIATSVAGIALLVANNPEENVNTDKAGFAVAGAGVAMTVLGGIFLGVTHRDNSVYTIPPVAVAPSPDGSGAGLIFQKKF